MTLEEQFSKLWSGYPADLCNGKRGGKVPALRAFKKIKPDDTEFKRIMENMKAQIKADRKEKDPYRWPFVSSYLNQARYDDFIMPQTESIPDQLNTCSVKSCSQKVHGASFKYCATHVPNAHADHLKNAWIRTGIDKNSPTLTEDCRAHCRERMNILLGAIS